jgi:hypothetical protein
MVHELFHIDANWQRHAPGNGYVMDREMIIEGETKAKKAYGPLYTKILARWAKNDVGHYVATNGMTIPLNGPVFVLIGDMTSRQPGLLLSRQMGPGGVRRLPTPPNYGRGTIAIRAVAQARRWAYRSYRSAHPAHRQPLRHA